MSKHLGNLKRLHQKLIVALGSSHPLVMQLQAEITSHAANLSKPVRCEFNVPRREMRRSFNHRWENLSGV
jgi:hypothetical protein